MDHIRILRRAFEITRFYRALWVFGILIALTTSRGGGNGGGGNGSGPNPTPRPGQTPPFPDLPMPNISQDVIGALIAAGVVLICLLLIIGIGLAILHYLSQTSLIRMVDGYEATGERVSVRQGFRFGWSRESFRLWLVDLLFGIIGFIVVILLLLLAAAPLLLLVTRNEIASVIGIVFTVGLVMVLILVMILVGTAISLWMQMIRREIVLGGRGVMEGIRSGWQLLTRHLGDVLIMGLILFGISLGLTIVTIPIFFLLAATGVLAGGLPALLAGGITSLFAQGFTPQIVAASIGIPIFLLVLIIPLTFIGGLTETFFSTTWTLTYRELLAMEAVRSDPLVGPGPEPEPVA